MRSYYHFYFSVWYRCSGFDRKRMAHSSRFLGGHYILEYYNQNATSLTFGRIVIQNEAPSSPKFIKVWLSEYDYK
jgi:hypothetical protein